MKLTTRLELNRETLRNLALEEASGARGGDTGGTVIDRPKLTITVCDGDTCSGMVSRWRTLC